MQSPVVQRYAISLILKYPPQHPIFKHRQYEAPSFTPVYKNKHNYSSVFINLRTFWIANWKTERNEETEMKYRVTILGVLQCSDSGEVTEQCGL